MDTVWLTIPLVVCQTLAYGTVNDGNDDDDDDTRVVSGLLSLSYHLGRVAPTWFNFDLKSNLTLMLVQLQFALHQRGSSVDLSLTLNRRLTSDQILSSFQL